MKITSKSERYCDNHNIAELQRLTREIINGSVDTCCGLSIDICHLTEIETLKVAIDFLHDRLAFVQEVENA